MGWRASLAAMPGREILERARGGVSPCLLTPGTSFSLARARASGGLLARTSDEPVLVLCECGRPDHQGNGLMQGAAFSSVLLLQRLRAWATVRARAAPSCAPRRRATDSTALSSRLPLINPLTRREHHAQHQHPSRDAAALLGPRRPVGRTGRTARPISGPATLRQRWRRARAIAFATWMANASQDLTGKAVGIWLCISAFPMFGGEHSIANQFLLPMALRWGRGSCTTGCCRRGRWCGET